jgi:hypothetical protein
MRSWTPDAADFFEAWLGRVRTSVAADPRVDPDDVAQDLRAHVNAELSGTVEPVTMGELSRVLDSLGQPAQWSDGQAAPRPTRVRTDWFQRNVAEALAGWQKRLGGDLGLPALLLPLTLLGTWGFEDGGFVLLAVAYFVARGQVMYVPDALVGRKRFLIYLPLALGSGTLVGLVLGFPLTFDGGRPFVHPFSMLWIVGLWWMFVGFVAGREPRRVRAILRPFADGFDASHGRMLSLLGAAFLIISIVVSFNGRF